MSKLSAEAAEFSSLLGGKERVLVSTHTSPDGDAIASALAALKILELLGSNPACYLAGQVPQRYRFLPGHDRIRQVQKGEEQRWDHALIVDCGSYPRIWDAADLIHPDAVLVNVDHHADNQHFGRLNVVYPEAPSTTQILFDLARALELPIDENLAAVLYVGLMTDTGGFRFSNTNERTFAAAAELTRLGARPDIMAEAVYSSNSPDAMKLLGEALTSLELTGGGRVATMTVHAVDNSEEWEDLSDFALAVDGVIASALFRVRENVTRVSLRGRGPVEVAGIAKRFGGGGHPKAAGFTGQGDPQEIRSRVVEALLEEVERRYAHSSDEE